MKSTALFATLLVTTALCTPAAIAQTSGDAGAATPPDAAADATSADEQDVDVSTPGVGGGSDIVVIGRNIPNVIRSTTQVVSVLSSEDIARTGDGDVAGALQRVTGLSVTGNGFVYVRGLGDRYSLALLNGSPIPSPEPLRRVVPLDIFPTSLLASTLVQKSYSVNYPGEFGGGVINLTTSATPKENFFQIGASVSGDSVTSLENGYLHYGSDTDWSGFDDGTRDVPAGLREAFGAGATISENATFDGEDLRNFAASLVNSPTSIVQRTRNIPLNMSFDLSTGQTFDMGDTVIGLIVNAGYSNNWRTRDQRQQTGATNTLASDFRSVRTENRIVVNGLIGLGAEFGEHDLRWTNLFIRDTAKQSRIAAGFSQSVSGEFDPTGIPDLIRQQTAWFERQLFSSQLVGEFDFDPLSIDVRGGYANSQREAPYERNFSYLYDPAIGDYTNNLTATGQSASISFSDLNEDVWSGALDVGYKLPTERSITVSAGYAYTDTKRSATRRDFSFRPANTLNSVVAQLRPDFLLSDYNVYTYDIRLVESSGLAGAAAYDAALAVHGGYLKVDAEVLPQVTLDVGVRYESAEQSVTLVDLFGTGGIAQAPKLENDYWLPAATVTWNFAENMQLRLNASKTIARPQFRELAPQLYLDTETDRQFIGNPFIVDSELFNAEARYEWYFDRGQRLTAAAFFKRIDKPIESVGTLAGGFTLQTTFANAPKADLYGAEIEVQKYFPLDMIGTGDFWASRRAVVIANYTYSKSKLIVAEGDTTILNDNRGARPATEVFADGAALTGQSEHLANLQLGLENTDRLSQQTLLFTYASDRITNRGPVFGGIRQPDIKERPGVRLDFVWREGLTVLGQEAEVKLEVRNITGQDFREFQDGEIYILNNGYEIGQSVSLGASLKF